MEQFHIQTFTIVTGEQQSRIHSPALPRLGVPYLDAEGSVASHLTVVAFEGSTRQATLEDGGLRIALPPAEFEALEKRLLTGPKLAKGKRYPYSVLETPVPLRFQLDSGQVLKFSFDT